MTTARSFLLLLLAAFFAFACNRPSYRTTNEEYAVVPAGEVHEGWYFAAGRQVSIHGTVNGDTYIAGGIVEVDGTINGMLVVAGGQVDVSGTVTDRILAAGGTVRLTGPTTKSVTAAGSTVTLGRSAVVGENLLVAGSTVQLNGTVDREAKAAGSEVQLSGTVKGNFDVAARRFDSFSGALVGGNLTIHTSDSTGVKVESGTVKGGLRMIVEKPHPEKQILWFGAGAFWFRIIFGLTLFLTALVLSFLAPRSLATAGVLPIDQPGQCLLWGIVVLIVTPVVAFLLCAILIGLPLGLFLLFFYIWFLYLSQLVLGATLGSRIYGLAGKSGWPLFGPVALGLVIIEVLMFIPVVSTIVAIAGLVVGVGAWSMITKMEWPALRAGASAPNP